MNLRNVNDQPIRVDVERGVEIAIVRTVRELHTMLVREGCSGSPKCALEIYVAQGPNYLNGLNLHMSDTEMDQVYEAIRAVRRARKAAA